MATPLDDRPYGSWELYFSVLSAVNVQGGASAQADHPGQFGQQDQPGLMLDISILQFANAPIFLLPLKICKVYLTYVSGIVKCPLHSAK